MLCNESECDFVTVSFGNGDVVAKVDSGADLSIVHPACIPSYVLKQARESGDVGTVRDVKLMSAFIGSGVTAELIHLPCQLMCEDGVVGKPVVITCAVTNKLREKMLLKPSDLKKLRDEEGVFGRSSPYSEGYTFEHSWFDMAQIPDEEGVVKEEE